MTCRILILLTLLLCWAPASVTHASERTLSGELVVIKGTSTQFRLVGHDGTFTAPAGTPLQELDGKDVVIEVSDGRVTEITEKSVAITPVTSGFETVRGQLVLRDAAAQSFGVVGDNSTYIAPPGVDLRPYVGKWVEASIDSGGRASQVTLLADKPPPAPIPPASSSAMVGRATCTVGDATVASGSSVCRGGVTHRCDNGAWVSLGTACQ
ncbi:MAG TPA: hypothetical protein VL049_04855 [Candidatus Dormibacteraeota bacterium]|nr:hypothetical protein [Candidatus Dormibacteraeota bacterium]